MDESVRTVLKVLGTGGTVEMAYRVITWMSGDVNTIGVQPGNIVDRAEIAKMVGQSRQAAAKTVKDQTFPAPFLVLTGGTELYDREQVARWIAGNPDHVGGP